MDILSACFNCMKLVLYFTNSVRIKKTRRFRVTLPLGGINISTTLLQCRKVRQGWEVHDFACSDCFFEIFLEWHRAFPCLGVKFIPNEKQQQNTHTQNKQPPQPKKTKQTQNPTMFFYKTMQICAQHMSTERTWLCICLWVYLYIHLSNCIFLGQGKKGGEVPFKF